jgi:hypothetical protein
MSISALSGPSCNFANRTPQQLMTAGSQLFESGVITSRQDAVLMGMACACAPDAGATTTSQSESQSRPQIDNRAELCANTNE